VVRNIKGGLVESVRYTFEGSENDQNLEGKNNS